MAGKKTVTASSREQRPPISTLQGDAWAAWNASYHAEAPDAYRAVGRALYQQDVENRITTLLARLDEQNRPLDALRSRPVA